MSQPWEHWYHVTGNTHGTWLRGSDLGFRERHHRIHVEGDYKRPPMPGRYSRLKQCSRGLMTQRPVYLSREASRMGAVRIAESFKKDGIEIRVLALDSHHYHLLIRCPDHRPKEWTARAKGRAAHALVKAKLAAPGKVWALGCGVKPVADLAHWNEADGYILRHRYKGAFVWHEEYGLLVPEGVRGR